MVRRMTSRVAFFTLLFAFPVLLQAAGPPSYEIIDLGALITFDTVSAINDNGQVVGRINGAPFVYANGTFTTLTASGGYFGAANGINDAGQIAGTFTPNGQGGKTVACRYDTGILTQLGTISGASGSSQGNAINTAGQVVGNSAYPSDNTAKQHAFRYSAGAMADLDTLGGTYSYALAVNASGQAAGYVNPSGGVYFHAFLTSGAAMTDLGTLPGGLESFAFGVNATGQVAGEANISGDTYVNRSPLHAFVYANGAMTDLGTLGGSSSHAKGINDAGAVVGMSAMPDATTTHAFLSVNGVMHDLNSLIVSHGNPGNLTLTEATAINNNGWIVGKGTVPSTGTGDGASGVPAGNFHGFLAKPRTQAAPAICVMGFLLLSAGP